MTVKNNLKGAGDNQHLLDISSDYNNFSNLVYFISEYKKAKKIIAQCKDFYCNFLRSKLYSFDDLKTVENINLLHFNVNWETYLHNCKLIYLFIVNKYLEKQINENLKTYHFSFYKESIYKSEYWGKDHNDNVWEVRGDEGTLLSCVESYKYWSCLYQIFILKNWNAHTTDEQSFQFDTFYKDALNLSEVNEKNKEIHKFTKTEITRYNKEGWGKNEKIVVCKTPISVVMFGDEEKKLFEIFEEAGNKFYPIYEEIKLHPEEYINEWKELNEFINNNFIIKEYSEDELKHMSSSNLQKLEYVKSHKGMLFPVDYYIGNEHYAIDAYKFINCDYVKYYEDHNRFEYKYNKEKRNNYNLVYDNLINSDLKDLMFIKCTELLYHIQTINPKYYKVKDLIFNTKKKTKKSNNLLEKYDFDNDNPENRGTKNNPYFVNDPYFYYVLIDNIPFKFSNDLDDVKITFNEEENVLECSYKLEHKYKKWKWPSDTPWTVETNTYVLKFDCATNEPIYFKHHYNEHEEKISYR